MTVYVQWIFFIIAILAGITEIALGDPLETWTTWSTAQPYVSKQVPPGAMIMRGAGTDAYYVMEVDPATGEIPVSLSGASITIDYSGATGAAVPADAAFIGGTDSGTLRGVKVDAAGELQVDVLSSALPSGAATAANQTTANGLLTTIDADTGNIATSTASVDTKTPALGQALMAASVPVAIASDQSDLPVAISAASTISVENLPATVDTNAGANSASTLRVTEGSRSYADSARYDYSGGSVTTGAWVEIDASTAAAINELCVTDQSGQVMELGSGAAAAETRILLIARGWSGCIPLRIAASTRLSLRAVSATASAGDFVYSGMQ